MYDNVYICLLIHYKPQTCVEYQPLDFVMYFQIVYLCDRFGLLIFGATSGDFVLQTFGLIKEKL
jgi:hypothetical protein